MATDVDTKRMLAYIIDVLILMTITTVVYVFMFAIIGVIIMIIPFLSPIFTLFSFLIALAIPFLYFYLLDSRGGTLGHRIMKIRSNANTAPNSKRIIRNILKSFFVIPIIIFIVKIVSNRWIHDEFSGITVQEI